MTRLIKPRHATVRRLVLTTAILAAFGGVAEAQQVGTAAAVNPASTARDLSGGMRTIVLGQSIAHREHIQTTAAGSVQLLFLDKTSMTIGPNSDVSIDEYVYDPQTNSGKLAATLAKGAMRFVGGQISHSGEATIKTASAVVGIRGGVSILTNAGVYLGYGSASVTSNDQSVTLQPGEYSTTSSGAPPTPPGPPPPNFIATFVKLFQSSGGQTGGTSPGAASQGKVTAAEQRATGSSGGPVSGTLPTGTTYTPPTTQTLVSIINQSIQTSNQQAFVQTVPPPPPQSGPPTGATAVAFNVSNCCTINGATSSAPFLPANFATGPNTYISPMVGYRNAGSDTTHFFQVGFNVSGNDTVQSSWAFVNIGKFASNSSGNPVMNAAFVGSASPSPGSIGAFAIGNDSTAIGALTLDANKLPQTGTITNNSYINDLQTYSTHPALYTTGPGGTPTPYTFEQQLQRIQTPSGLGDFRPAAGLNGWVGGLMQTYDNTANGFLAPPSPLFGTAGIVLDPTKSRVQASFDIAFSSGNRVDYAHYQFGSVDPNMSGNSAYIDYNNFAALTALDNNGAPVSTTNGQPMQSHAGFIFAVPKAAIQQIANGLPGGTKATFCDCEYTRWGFWASQNLRVDSNGHSVTDINHLGTWVAGQLPQISDMPTTGTATYAGHIIGTVNNGGGQHIDAGNFSNTVNFGTRTGNVMVTNFDGTNYNGTTAAPSSDPRLFAGVLTGNNGYRYMQLSGNFFRGPTSPVGEMGGNFTVVGTRYIGSGIFAAAIPH